jgi:RHS repeat-associated protein
VSASFVYDGLGRREKKTINSNLTEFLFDGINPVQESSGATILANIGSGLRIDELITRTDVATSTASYFLADALGSTLALTDNSGTIQTEYTYEPFGASTTTGASNSNSFKYTAREDDGSGLYYYRARYHHTILQRFISEDPLECLQWSGKNLYTYVSNQPLRYTDPLGLIEQGEKPGPVPPLPPLPPGGRKDPPVPPEPTPDMGGGRPDGPDGDGPSFGGGTGGGGERVSTGAGAGSQLDDCLKACKSGIRAIEAFCRQLRDPRFRAICWANRWSPVACQGACYLLFGD